MATTLDDDVTEQGSARAHRALLPDPRYLLMVFRRRLWLFLAVAAVVLALAGALTLTITPRYAATASVLIEPRKDNVIDLTSVVSGLPADTNVVDTETQLIGSPTVALQVVRALHLDRDPEFVGPPSDTPAPPAPRQPTTAAERAAVAGVLAKVSIRRQGLTYVIDITATSSAAEKATNIANAFAREYLAVQTARKVGVSQTAADWVSKRTDALRGQAVADDAAVQHYMIAHNLMSAEGATMAEQEVSSLNTQIAQAEANVAQERGKLAAARSQIGRGGGGADVGAVLSSDTIRALRAQEATASSNLATLQARYGDLYPDVQKAKENLADTRAQLRAESGRIISTLQANVAVAESGLASLRASVARSRGSLATNSEAQVGLLELQRKADASKAVYNAFLQRAKETGATTTLPQADASISSLARLPDAPVWPNRKLAGLFGLVAAIGAGLLAIAIAEYLDGSVATREDLEGRLGARYAGAVPDLKSATGRARTSEAPQDYVLSHPFSVFVESLRSLASFATLRGTGPQVIAIASPLPREGKTTLAVCLARTLAMSKKRVVLVDADLRRHSASNLLAPHAGERLLGALDGTLTLADALVIDAPTGLAILPTTGPDAANDLTPAKVRALFDALRAEFDVVIVDTAPVLGVVETRVIARNADATLLVCRWRDTALKAAQTALDILRQGDAKVAGVALSMVDIRAYASTGQADSYSYHRRFTGYYAN